MGQQWRPPHCTLGRLEWQRKHRTAAPPYSVPYLAAARAGHPKNRRRARTAVVRPSPKFFLGAMGLCRAEEWIRQAPWPDPKETKKQLVMEGWTAMMVAFLNLGASSKGGQLDLDPVPIPHGGHARRRRTCWGVGWRCFASCGSWSAIGGGREEASRSLL